MDYASAIGTAISPDDFTSTSGTLNNPAGAASGTVIVQIIDDALYEAEESFVLNLSNPINASIVDNQGIGTITDNDAAPSLTIDDIDTGPYQIFSGSGTSTFGAAAPCFVYASWLSLIHI